MSKGDHIKVHRVGYWHHGIDLGDGTVVHFTGEPGRKTNATVKRTLMEEFLSGGKLVVVEYSESYNPEEVVKRALSMLWNGGYNFIFNNCEHFARYCKTGEKKSEQVKDAAYTSGAAVGTGAVTPASIAGVSAAGTVAGLSGPGVMSALAAIGPGGAIGGVLTLASAPAILTNVALNKVLEDDKKLSMEEREARKAGRVAAKVGTVAGAAGTVGTISAAGTTAGLSAAGITSGLAAVGSTFGGGMVAGVAISVAAPAVAAAVIGLGMYKLWKIL